MNAPIRQCVLQSGSLYLSPPQSNDTADGLVRKMEGAVASLGDWTLFDAPVQIVLRAQADLGLVSFYIQAEELLEEWEENNGSVERLLIGDTEYEVSRTDYPWTADRTVMLNN